MMAKFHLDGIVYFQIICGAEVRLVDDKKVTFISKNKLNLALIMMFSINFNLAKSFVFLRLLI